ncbi:MAG: DUF748 domain-containing protein [Saprospiraceae bacterium]|nr:DUF748 domain-containing protein [Saprospiraceae bacterium]
MKNWIKGKMRNKKVKIVAIIIVVLVAARIALPYVILHYANKKLASLDALYGHIDDIDIALYRGAYKIDSIYINKKDAVSGKQTKFFASDVIDLSVEWSALFKGRIVGELVFDRPSLVFTKDKTEPKDIQKDSSDFKTVLDGLMPLKVNRFEVNEGIVRYVDQTSKPKVDVEMNNTFILGQNLSSVVDTALLPSTVTASSNIYGGTMKFNMKLNALEDKPTFDLNAELENLQLTKLNEFFQAYANFDVNKGSLGLYTEIAAKEGAFVGYVKPIIKDLDVLGKEDRKDNLGRKIWEGIIGGAGIVFRNPKKEQVATKLPISGTFDNTDNDIWHAIIVLLRNAFIQALQPSLDAEINIGSVDIENVKEEKKGFLKKIFGGKKKNDKKKEKD